MKKERGEESEDLVIQGALFGADDRSPLDPLPHPSSQPSEDGVEQSDHQLHRSESRAERLPHPIVTPHFRDQALWDDDADLAPASSHDSLPGINALFGLPPTSSAASSTFSSSTAPLSDPRSESSQSEQTPQEKMRKPSRRVRLFRQRFEEAEKGEHAKIAHRHIDDQPDTVGQGGRMVNREAQRSQLFVFSLLSEAEQPEVSHPSNETPLDIVYGSGDRSESGSGSVPSHPSSPSDQSQAVKDDVSAHPSDRSSRQYSHARWIISFSALNQAVCGPYSFDFSLSYEFWDRLSTLIKSHIVVLPDFTARRVLQQIGDPNLAQWITDLSNLWTVLPDAVANDLNYAQVIGKVTGHQIAIIGEMSDEKSVSQPQSRSSQTQPQSTTFRPVKFVSLTAFMKQARGF